MTTINKKPRNGVNPDFARSIPANENPTLLLKNLREK